ncbi:hypothetical protein [Arthrobacter sp. NPDC090010]|uniref:hypothetical protein n=1 Tax=Arthrobacter sp. NPDC090010 TaxID=3363942 RepID=UPI0037F984CD
MKLFTTITDPHTGEPQLLEAEAPSYREALEMLQEKVQELASLTDRETAIAA